MNVDNLLPAISSLEQKLQNTQDYLKIRKHQEIVRTVPILARLAVVESALEDVHTIASKLAIVSPNKWLRFSHGLTINIDNIDSLCCSEATTLHSIFPYITLSEKDGIWFAVVMTKLNTIILNKYGLSLEGAQYIVNEVSAVLGNHYTDVESFDLILDVEGMIDAYNHLKGETL